MVVVEVVVVVAPVMEKQAILVAVPPNKQLHIVVEVSKVGVAVTLLQAMEGEATPVVLVPEKAVHIVVVLVVAVGKVDCMEVQAQVEALALQVVEAVALVKEVGVVEVVVLAKEVVAHIAELLLPHITLEPEVQLEEGRVPGLTLKKVSFVENKLVSLALALVLEANPTEMCLEAL